MSISKEFMDAVAAGNKLRTRIMLSNYMITDPSFREFDESLKYALESMNDLVVPHDEEELVYDVTAWTKEYLDKERGILVNNFSQERIDLLRQICSHIYGKRVEEGHREEFVCEAKAKRESVGMSKKQIGTITAGAGVIATATGLAVSSTALTVAGAIAAVAGGVLILTDK